MLQGPQLPEFLALIRKLCLAGGSTRGFAYVGLVEELQFLGLLGPIHTIAGTSVGAIVGLLVSTGWTFEKICEIYSIINPKDWSHKEHSLDTKLPDLSELKDFEVILNDAGETPSLFKLMSNMFNHYGLHTGNAYLLFFKAIVEHATKCPSCLNPEIHGDCKVKDEDGKCLFGKDGYAGCTYTQWHLLKEAYPHLGLKDLCTDAAEMFEEDSENWEFSYKSPNESLRHVPIADGTRASIAMHTYFTPQRINGAYYSDGGVQYNCPINRIVESNKAFDPSCLAVWLASEKEIRLMETRAGTYNHFNGDRTRIQSAPQLFKATFGAINSTQRSSHIQSPYAKNHTIYVDTLGIGMLNMELTIEEKRSLKISGQYAVIRWLAINPDTREFAKQKYGEKLIQLIMNLNFTPSVEEFMQQMVLDFKIEYTSDEKNNFNECKDLNDEQSTKEMLNGWVPILGFMDIIRKTHKEKTDTDIKTTNPEKHKPEQTTKILDPDALKDISAKMATLEVEVNPGGKKLPCELKLPSAMKSYLPLFSNLNDNLQRVFFKFLSDLSKLEAKFSIDTLKTICPISEKAPTDPVILSLNGKSYNRPNIRRFFHSNCGITDYNKALELIDSFLVGFNPNPLKRISATESKSTSSYCSIM
jgi:predicted acylesterase/phospholipase RssA